MGENYIFTQTASGDRTNIMCNFPIWDKQMFVDHVKSGNRYGRYRYSAIGGYMDLLKGMSLEEFDKIFHPEEFTPEEITSLFRKEISLKYGEHVEKIKIKALSKKELERDCAYEDLNGSTWIYYGEVEQTIDKDFTVRYQSMKKNPIEVNKGFGFQHYWGSSLEGTATNLTIIKSLKKLVKKVEGVKIELEQEYVLETKDTSWSRGKQVILKLL